MAILLHEVLPDSLFLLVFVWPFYGYSLSTIALYELGNNRRRKGLTLSLLVLLPSIPLTVEMFKFAPYIFPWLLFVLPPFVISGAAFLGFFRQPKQYYK
jgi:hypothetical protein